MNKLSKIFYKIFKVIGWLLFFLLVLIIMILLFVRSPWGQEILVDRAVSYVSNKTQTKIELEKLYITFSGDLFLKGLYLEDQNGDTLVYSNELETGLEVLPLVKSGAFHLSKLKWDGLKATIKREDETEAFNFDFLLAAFVSTDTTKKQSAAAKGEEAGFPEIKLGPIELRNLDLQYKDAAMGIDSRLNLGELILKVGQLDLAKMDFYIKDFQFRETEAYYRQTKPFVSNEEDDDAKSPKPLFIVDHLQLENVTAIYESLPDEIKANIQLGNFIFELPEANLETQKIDLRTLELTDSKIELNLPEPGNDQASGNMYPTASDEGNFQWPDWIVDVSGISLERNEIKYRLGKEKNLESGFNPNAVHLSDLNLRASQVYLKEGGAGLSLHQLDFFEQSGIDLRGLAFRLGIEDTFLKLDDLQFSTGKSQVLGDLNLSYASIDDLIGKPEHSGFSARISELNFDVSDILPFAPDLEKNPYFKALLQNKVSGRVIAEGSLSEINVKEASANWGDDTRFSTKGTITQPLEMDKLFLDLSALSFSTINKDIRQFVKEEDYGVTFPKKMDLNGQIKGALEDMVADASLEMPEGRVHIKGNYKNTQQLVFDVNLEGQKLQLGELLPGKGLGTTSFHISTSGQGNSLEELNALLRLNFTELEYNAYDFSGLTLRGNMKDGHGKANLSFSDENLDMDLGLDILLDSVNSHYTANLDLRGANLMGLGLYEKDIRTKLKLKADFEGIPDAFDLFAEVTEGVVIHEDRSYPLGNFDLKTRVRPDSTSLDIGSLMLNGHLRSNASPEAIARSMQRHFERYMKDSLSIDSLNSEPAKSSPVDLDLELSFKRAPVLDQVFLEGLEKLDSIGIAIDYSEQKDQFQGNLTLPFMEYNSIKLDDLEMAIEGDGSEVLVEIGIAGLDAQPVSMGATKLVAAVKNRELSMNFQSFDEKELLYFMDSKLTYNEDTLEFRVVPEGLVINKKDWNTPQTNHLKYAGNSLLFEDFSFSQNGQKITFSNEMNQNISEQVGVEFDNFQLASILSLFNPDSLLLEGQMQGAFIVENPFGAMGLVADLDIRGMKAMGVELGNLAVNAKSKGTQSYDFDLALKDKGIDFDMVGDYLTSESGANLDMKLDLNRFELKVLEKLLPNQFSEAAGDLKGRITVNGTTASPKYEGDFRFENAAINVKALNSKYTLPNQPLRVDEKGVYFDKVTVQDAAGNNFILDGEIDTEDFTNIGFDLQLTANQFQLLDSDKSDNELFYGKANVDADVSISGNSRLPKVNADLKINKETDITFVIPETELEIVEREGVVLIVDRDNPNDVLTKRERERSSSSLTGMDVQAILKVDPDAMFKVIIDERSGDNLMIAGDADLNLSIAPNGQMNLSGVYELNKGHYEMSLYNLVSRKFDILEGSSITWKGDPMDADLDITASYEVKASANDLMASQISGLSADVANQYRQRLPFLVYLNVDGELIRPQISFQLDMPEDVQGTLGGNVYSKIQQVNDEEGELNRQVFSLLVLQKFMSSTGGDGTSGGTAGLARSSVSQMLSSQLNALSSNVLGRSGFELDFDLDSYSDYQGDKTQLSVNARKRLFDDRLIVQVGSQMDLEGSSQNNQGNSAVFGNVNIEYLLTETGRYRIRGFRRTQFESIIDGQLIVTGIAFILNREFNKFYEFWHGEKKQQQDERLEEDDEGELDSAVEENDKLKQ